MSDVWRFEDGSVLKIPKEWIECAKIKHGLEWEDYWKMVKPVIDKLWEQRLVLTKFGKMSFEEHESYYGIKIDSRAKHAKRCIYADLRVCLMAKALEIFGNKELPQLVAINENGVYVYRGSKKETKTSFSEFLNF